MSTLCWTGIHYWFNYQTMSRLILEFSKEPGKAFLTMQSPMVLWAHSHGCLMCCWGFSCGTGSILILMKQKMKSSLQLFITGLSEPFIIVSRWEARAPCLIHVAASLWNYLWWCLLMPAYNTDSCSWKNQTTSYATNCNLDLINLAWLILMQ